MAYAAAATATLLIGPAFTDDRLTRIAALVQPEARLAVVGAPLSGQPLNPRLLSLGAHLEHISTTAPAYRLHALRTTPPKPGLVHVGEGGAPIETESGASRQKAWAAFCRPSPAP